MNDQRAKHMLRAKRKSDQAQLDQAVEVILKGVPPELTREQIVISSDESAPRVLLGDDARTLEPSGEVYEAMGKIIGLAVRSDWTRQHLDRCAYYYVK
ncbi:MAG TPA: hypothetical protein VL361_19520 [Candidatus Limnocylindrales bacterium]|nr:hypothetical protein [Candidatus Limnocylindrales bacterium]